jgi:uncharacterized protein (DUF2141 family)
MKSLIIIVLSFAFLSCFSQTLTVEISGIRSEKGVIQLSVYSDKETFANEIPFRGYSFEKTEMKNGILLIKIADLPPGNYGIALIDDTNQNGKIDFRFFIPCEGFGFSNYPFKGTRKPDFESFAFHFSEEEKLVKIGVQYF